MTLETNFELISTHRLDQTVTLTYTRLIRPDQQSGATTENVIQDEGRPCFSRWDRHVPGLAAIHLSAKQPVRPLATLEQQHILRLVFGEQGVRVRQEHKDQSCQQATPPVARAWHDILLALSAQLGVRSGMTLRSAFVATGLLLCSNAAAFESFELTGFSRIASTYVDGDFEGADYDKVVELENGMAFEFNTYHYTYAYRPKVEVFKKTFSVAELRALKVKNPTRPVTLYKLLIKDYVYSAFRLR